MTAEATDFYTGDDYAEKHPTWHDEYCAGKAGEIVKLLRRNNLHPRRIVDVGCGAGGVLQSTLASLGADVVGEGFDIAPRAISLAAARAAPNLSFRCEDFLASDSVAPPDLLLCIDVFEHVEDYIGILRKLRTRSQYFIFHIPLDMNVKGLLRNHHLKERREVGHLHYFEFHAALATLTDAGYVVMDHFYTRTRAESILTKAITVCEHLLSAITSRHFAVKILGGVSLLVLARAAG